ncbi:MAG TPA: redoxin domain-containing protein [Planctomycetota bacterium]
MQPVSGLRPRTAGLPGLCVTAAAFVLIASSAAAQGVGDRIPPIRLKTTAGENGRLAAEGGALTLDVAGKQTNPKVLLVHFLQPDCLQCEAEARALDAMTAECGGTGAVILGLAHRGNAASVAAFRDRLKLAYPVLLLEADEASTKLAAGDATRIVDRTGVIRFAQAGFGDGDQRTWREAISALLDGREVKATAPARAVLKAGDRMPVIELPALIGDGKLALRGTEGGLAFEDTQDRVTRPSAAVGFFSRY